MEEETTYQVVRKYVDTGHENHNKVIHEGLTREEAQEYCSYDDSKEDGVWMDVFYAE